MNRTRFAFATAGLWTAAMLLRALGHSDLPNGLVLLPLVVGVIALYVTTWKCARARCADAGFRNPKGSATAFTVFPIAAPILFFYPSDRSRSAASQKPPNGQKASQAKNPERSSAVNFEERERIARAFGRPASL